MIEQETVEWTWIYGRLNEITFCPIFPSSRNKKLRKGLSEIVTLEFVQEGGESIEKFDCLEILEVLG